MENIQEQLMAAQAAKRDIQQLKISHKEEILIGLAAVLENQIPQIIEANRLDLAQMSLADPKRDRLLLDEQRILALSTSLRAMVKLKDPTAQVLSERILENGLHLQKKTVALGVVAVIYESRPNVTIDVAALCIQSGNVCLLRGGTDAYHTNKKLVSLIHYVFHELQINPNIVQLLPVDRELVKELLTATKYVDIIIPRGSQTLIDYVRTHAKVPVIETGAGVCHTYVEQSADLIQAVDIVVNAKVSRPSVCNALDTVLVDQLISKLFLQGLFGQFLNAGVEIFADAEAYDILKELGYPYLQEAQEADFGREFLDLKCSIRIVQGLDDALTHIDRYSSKHSECIVSKNQEAIEIFMQAVDAAAVYANASTRFTDGGEFGLGAEIGISTQKLHARGPFALEKLVTEKWFVTGNGQIR